MNHQQHESADLIQKAEQIKREYGQRAIERMELDGEMRRLEQEYAALGHTYGTVNPGKGWGSL